MGSTNVSEAIMNVLKMQDKPLGVEEIAFRTRTARSIISEILVRLKKAQIVKQVDADSYQLNKEKEFNLLKMYE